MKWTKLLHTVDLPYHLANHIVGEKHTPRHRTGFAIVVMIVGAAITHKFQEFGNPVISLLGELLGTSIHATGFIPFAHSIEEKAKQEPIKKDDQNSVCLTC